MVNSYLIELIRLLSPEERRELALFVASPYHNRGFFAAETQELLRIIETSSPGFSSEALKKDKIYAGLFPGAPVVEGKLDKVMSELHKLAKAFVASQQYLRPENEFQQLLDLGQFFIKRGSESRYLKTVKQMEELLAGESFQEREYFQKAFMLENEVFSYESQHNQKRGDLNIPKALQALDLYYFLSKTELLNHYLLQQKVTQLEIPEEIAQSMSESYLPERYSESFPVLKIAYQIFQLLEKEEPQVSEMEQLLELLKKQEAAIPPRLLKDYYTYARNFCVLLVNNGRREMLPVLFSIQKENLGRGYLHYNGKITPSAFLNVTNAGLLLKEYDWTANFIKSQKGKILDDNETEDYYHLIKANFLFHKGDFDKAIDVLPPSFKELSYHIFSRRLEMKIYYELGSDLLPYKISAFKMYLSRTSKKTISPQIWEQNSNFVNILFQLYSSEPGNKERMRKLHERVLEKKSIVDREWLLEKTAK